MKHSRFNEEQIISILKEQEAGLARLYGEARGKLIEFGKPHRPIYDFASSLLGSPAGAEVLAIGDNLLTDIAGVAGCGIDWLLVREGGVHGDSSPASPRGASGARPTYLAPRPCW